MSARTACVAGLILIAATGCSGGSASTADDSPSTPAKIDNGPGNSFVLAECGGITDAEITGALGVPDIKRLIDNSLGCFWSNSMDYKRTSIALYWYRGSWAQKEADFADSATEAVRPVDIAGFPGFEARSGTSERVDSCALAAGTGTDFVYWTLTNGQGTVADPCKVVNDLMRRLLDRVGLR